MNTMKELLLFPFNGNSREAITAVNSFRASGDEWTIRGFLDDDERLHGNKYIDIPILGNKSLLLTLPSYQILAVPGNSENYLQRKRILDELSSLINSGESEHSVNSNQIYRTRFASIVDRRAVVASDAKIGVNTMILANVFLGPGVTIGNHCVILPNSVVAHESSVGDYTMIGSNVTISGGCTIEQNCYIGSGTRIREKIKVGQKSLLGLGSCLIRDVKDHSVMVGNPARLLRETIH